MKKIRVLHISLTDNIGGIETFLLNLYQNINREKFQFDFISQSVHPAFQEEFHRLGAHIFTLPVGYRHPIQYCRKLAEILHSVSYDIVHIHKNSAADLLPFLVCHKLKMKTVIAHAHNTSSTYGNMANLLHKINKRFLPFLYTDAFACSQLAAKWMFPRSKLNEVKIIKNGIDTGVFAFRPDVRTEVRNRLKLNNRFVVGHIGRFVPQKNHGFLLDVFYSMYQKDPQSVLMLIGSGKLEPSMRKKVKMLGIENCVLFLGERDDVPKLLQAMDVFVLPSLYEGLPVVAVEAQASGLPCIISDTVSQEIALTKRVEFLSLSEPPETWADYLISVQKAAGCRNTADQIVKAGYDIKSTVRLLTNFYSQKVKGSIL